MRSRSVAARARSPGCARRARSRRGWLSAPASAVLPIDSLLAVAEDARVDATTAARLGAHRRAHGPDLCRRVRARRRTLDDARRAVPDRLRSARGASGGTSRRRAIAGNAIGVFGARLQHRRRHAVPRRDADRACAAASRRAGLGRRRRRRSRPRLAALRARQGRGDRGRACARSRVARRAFERGSSPARSSSGEGSEAGREQSCRSAAASREARP